MDKETRQKAPQNHNSNSQNKKPPRPQKAAVKPSLRNRNQIQTHDHYSNQNGYRNNDLQAHKPLPTINKQAAHNGRNTEAFCSFRFQSNKEQGSRRQNARDDGTNRRRHERGETYHLVIPSSFIFRLYIVSYTMPASLVMLYSSCIFTHLLNNSQFWPQLHH